ncbi:MAG: hypothetical protein P8N01_06110, partial [Burkholderiales bacterium]|nr:hypothetical protein [Burkholderiales bacterium]
ETFLNDLGLKALTDLPPLEELGELVEETPELGEQMSLDVGSETDESKLTPAHVPNAPSTQSLN